MGCCVQADVHTCARTLMRRPNLTACMQDPRDGNANVYGIVLTPSSAQSSCRLAPLDATAKPFTSYQMLMSRRLHLHLLRTHSICTNNDQLRTGNVNNDKLASAMRQVGW